MLTIAEKGCNFFCVETKKTLAIAEKGCLMLDGKGYSYHHTVNIYMFVISVSCIF